MKKLTFCILSLMLVFCLPMISYGAENDATDSSDFLYVQNNGEVHIKSYTGTDPNVIIPSEIDGAMVTTIENEAFSGNQDIQSITFPNTITSIGENAFFNCINLKKIEFPLDRIDYLTIGPAAFSYCDIAGEVVINSNHLEIGYWAFSGNVNMTDFVILSDEIWFGDSVFSYCSSLKSVYMKSSASATYVGAFGNSNEGDVFANLNSLEAAYLPKDCTFLTEYTFENSPSVVIYVPEDSGIIDKATELWLPTNTSAYEEKTAEILDEVSAQGYDLSESGTAEYNSDDSQGVVEVTEETEALQEIETEISMDESIEIETDAESGIENESELQTEPMTETNMEDASNNSLEGEPLTRNDFFITFIDEGEGYDEMEEEIMSYDNDALSYLDSYYPEDGGAVYASANKEINGIEGPDDTGCTWQTYRGIYVGDFTKNDVVSAYGLGLDLLFNTYSDPFYDAIYNENDPYFARLFEEYAKEVLVYSYKNLYQIAFYIDNENNVLAIFYLNFVAYEADEATTLSVQKSLNILGYDCGDPDGIVGSKTIEAIEKYQDDNDLFVSGTIDDELLKSLYGQEAITLDSGLTGNEDSYEESLPQTTVIEAQTEVNASSLEDMESVPTSEPVADESALKEYGDAFFEKLGEKNSSLTIGNPSIEGDYYSCEVIYGTSFLATAALKPGDSDEGAFAVQIDETYSDDYVDNYWVLLSDMVMIADESLTAYESMGIVAQTIENLGEYFTYNENIYLMDGTTFSALYHGLDYGDQETEENELNDEGPSDSENEMLENDEPEDIDYDPDLESIYQEALILVDNNSFAQAAWLFRGLEDYKDSGDIFNSIPERTQEYITTQADDQKVTMENIDDTDPNAQIAIDNFVAIVNDVSEIFNENDDSTNTDTIVTADQVVEIIDQYCIPSLIALNSLNDTTLYGDALNSWISSGKQSYEDVAEQLWKISEEMGSYDGTVSGDDAHDIYMKIILALDDYMVDWAESIDTVNINGN